MKSKRAILIAGLMGFLLLVIFGVYSIQNKYRLQPKQVTAQSFVKIQSLESFTENYVTVELTLEKDAEANIFLASTYTPTKADHHLYSKDLPKKGIEGAGRPTLLELPQEDNIRVAGQLIANQPVIHHWVREFSEPFPIYPDGPVTLRLPIEVVNINERPIQTEVSLTYMACSSQGRCLPPVMDKRVTITIPDGILTQ